MFRTLLEGIERRRVIGKPARGRCRRLVPLSLGRGVGSPTLLCTLLLQRTWRTLFAKQRRLRVITGFAWNNTVHSEPGQLRLLLRLHLLLHLNLLLNCLIVRHDIIRKPKTLSNGTKHAGAPKLTNDS